MGKIPQFEQQQLAQQSVGTPGVAKFDTGTDTAFGHLTQAADKLSSAVGQIIQYQRALEAQELRQKEREQRALQKEIMDQTRDLDREKRETEASIEMQGLVESTKTDFTSSPTGASKAFLASTDDIISKHVEVVTDPLLKMQLETALQRRKSEMGRGIESWETSQSIENSKANFNQLGDMYARSAQNISTPEELMVLRSKIEGLKERGEKLFGKQAGESIIKWKDEADDNYLANVQIKNPALLEKTVMSDTFKDTNSDIKLKYVNSARAVERWQRAEDNRVTAESHNTEVFDAYEGATPLRDSEDKIGELTHWQNAESTGLKSGNKSLVTTARSNIQRLQNEMESEEEKAKTELEKQEKEAKTKTEKEAKEKAQVLYDSPQGKATRKAFTDGINALIKDEKIDAKDYDSMNALMIKVHEAQNKGLISQQDAAGYKANLRDLQNAYREKTGNKGAFILNSLQNQKRSSETINNVSKTKADPEKWNDKTQRIYNALVLAQKNKQLTAGQNPTISKDKDLQLRQKAIQMGGN